MIIRDQCHASFPQKKNHRQGIRFKVNKRTIYKTELLVLE